MFKKQLVLGVSFRSRSYLCGSKFSQGRAFVVLLTSVDNVGDLKPPPFLNRQFATDFKPTIYYFDFVTKTEQNQSSSDLCNLALAICGLKF
jgi:hypothetical protein